MSYVLKKTIRGRKYFYLVKNVRVARAWKKFTIYMGKGKLSKKRLGELKKKYSKILDRKVTDYLKSIDPLLRLLSGKQIAELEKIKAAYRKAHKAMSATVRRRWYEWFLAAFTYNTNAIEGSTVNLLETSMILFEGLMPPGKTVREVREVENHKKAFDYVMEYGGDVNKAFVCELHRQMTSGILEPTESGNFRRAQVFVRGAEVVPPRPEEVEKQFKELMLWYRGNKKKYHPVVVAAYVHTAFEGIHPFVDYNGRTGRLLLNFILMKHGFPPIAIAYRRRAEYYKALRAAIRGDLESFVRLVYKYLKETKPM
ncbi:MAG: Fic family protein [Hadesarchaea archaeon]|nr:Fic family protein [Hadesarchaea archaeon]